MLVDDIKILFFYQKYGEFVHKYSYGRLFVPKNEVAHEAVETLVYLALRGEKGRKNGYVRQLQKAMMANDFSVAASIMAAAARNAVTSARASHYAAMLIADMAQIDDEVDELPEIRLERRRAGHTGRQIRMEF